MAVLFALFDDAESALATENELVREFGRGGRCLVQRHTRAPLDGNILPEGATEFGRNIAIAMGAGGVFMAVAGGLAGAFDLMLGMGVGMGVALGFVTGLLMGLVGAMQAGTRIPKPALRQLEPRLGHGRVLLVVELDDAARVDAVHDAIEHHAPVVLETC